MSLQHGIVSFDLTVLSYRRIDVLTRYPGPIHSPTSRVNHIHCRMSWVLRNNIHGCCHRGPPRVVDCARTYMLSSALCCIQGAAEDHRLALEPFPRCVNSYTAIKYVLMIPTGKRYNVLRKRIDSWSYDVDQLLFGTILFTLVAFLFPTTVTYYALFALVRTILFFSAGI